MDFISPNAKTRTLVVICHQGPFLTEFPREKRSKEGIKAWKSKHGSIASTGNGSDVGLLGSPSSQSHALLNRGPDALDNLPISPAPGTIDAAFVVPSLNGKAVHATPPPFDG